MHVPLPVLSGERVGTAIDRGTRVRVWWPPTFGSGGQKPSGGAFYPATVVDVLASGYSLKYANDEVYTSSSDCVFPYDNPCDFGREAVPLRVGEFVEVHNGSATGPGYWVARVVDAGESHATVDFPFDTGPEAAFEVQRLRRVRFLDTSTRTWSLIKPYQLWEPGEFVSPLQLEFMPESEYFNYLFAHAAEFLARHAPRMSDGRGKRQKVSHAVAPALHGSGLPMPPGMAQPLPVAARDALQQLTTAANGAASAGASHQTAAMADAALPQCPPPPAGGDAPPNSASLSQDAAAAAPGVSATPILMWVAPVPQQRVEPGQPLLFQMTPVAGVPPGSWPTLLQTGAWASATSAAAAPAPAPPPAPPAPPPGADAAARPSVNPSLAATLLGGRTRRDPTMPKRATTAYLAFLNKHKGAITEAHPEWGQAQVTDELARMWRNVSEVEKTECQAVAEEDKRRYESEFAAWKALNPGESAWPRGGKRPPKKPHNAYVLFVQDFKRKLKESKAKGDAEPSPEQLALDAAGGDVNAAVSAAWKALGEEARAVFSEQAQQLRVAYDAELEQFAAERMRQAMESELTRQAASPPQSLAGAHAAPAQGHNHVVPGSSASAAHSWARPLPPVSGPPAVVPHVSHRLPTLEEAVYPGGPHAPQLPIDALTLPPGMTAAGHRQP